MYNLAPNKPSPRELESYVTWNDGFSTNEIDSIVALGDMLNIRRATIIGGDDDKIRKSKTGWMNLDESNSWIFDRFGAIIREINSEFYQFDLTGIYENLQYTVYDESDDHYTWHIDQSPKSSVTRKLSLVLQLSDPYEYEGGYLQIQNSHKHDEIERRKGLIVAFPSFRMHRVTPVTGGIRKSLVVWAGGPKFR